MTRKTKARAPLAPLRVGALSRAAEKDPRGNADGIVRAMGEAAREGVRLLATPECALTGYAGVERETPDDLDRRALRDAEAAVAEAARRHGMYIALGTTVFRGGAGLDALRLLGPDGKTRQVYAKRAMYGEDAHHYAPGGAWRIARVDGWRVGLRICFEFRFPEYFRELLRARAHLCVMAFCMVGPTPAKREVARAHLLSRAAENGIFLLAANSTSRVQNAPTLAADPAGAVLAEAAPDTAGLIVCDLVPVPLPPVPASILAHARRLAEPRTGCTGQH